MPVAPLSLPLTAGSWPPEASSPAVTTEVPPNVVFSLPRDTFGSPGNGRATFFPRPPGGRSTRPA